MDQQILLKDTHAYPDLELYLSMEPVTSSFGLLFLLLLLPPAAAVILVPLALHLRKNPRPSQAARLAEKAERKGQQFNGFPPAASTPTVSKPALGPAEAGTSPKVPLKPGLGSTASGASARASPKPAAGAA